MSHRFSMRWIPALLMAVSSGSAVASGFQLLEQGSGLGNAYAGSAAKSSDASTIWYNPAGMTQLPGGAFSGGVTAVRPVFKFSDSGSRTGVFSVAGDGGDAGSWGFPPNAYISWAVNKDFYLGLGINAPFGLATKYSDPWTGSAQSNEFDIKTINVNPSVAYRVNEMFSIGAGANWQRIEADYYRRAAAAPAGPLALPFVTSHLSVSDNAWGWNLGILLTPSPSTKVGLSYRSAVSYHTDGNITLVGDGAAGAATALGLTAAGVASNASANIKVPDTWILSATQKLSDQWEMLGDISWTGWSSIKNIDIMHSSGRLVGTTAEVLPADFQNTFRVALGANYAYTDSLKFMFGLAYDRTPVKNSTSRLTSLPDNDRTWFSLGAQWKPAKEQTLEVGAAYLYLPNTGISHATATGGLVNGDYNSSVWILGAQYSIGF